MTKVEEVIHRLSQWLNWVAAGAIVVMMLLVCLNIVTRLFGQPILGTFEFVGFLGAIVVAFALAYTSVVRGHVAVGIVVSRLPQRTQAIIDSVTTFLGIGIFSLITWQGVKYAARLWDVGEVSPTMELSYFPIAYAIAACFAIACLVLLLDLFKSLAQAVRK